MMPIPWSHVRSWRCTGCGLCCRRFEVVLKFNEWLRLVQKYGVGVTNAGLNKFYLGKKPDGTCIFLYTVNGVWFCGLQNMKPVACKLWPFKVLDRPRYGRAKEAFFSHEGKKLFVYTDPFCPEITWGKPGDEMVHKVIPEFVEIALGLREKQFYSTSTMLYDLYPRWKGSQRII